MTQPPQQFASDNYAGICPEAWAALERANAGSAVAYGDDAWTERAADAFRTLFAAKCEVFFVFNGTAANSLALAALCQSYHSVICSAAAHALSRMKSVRDLRLASAARRRTFSCSGVARRPNRADRRSAAFLEVAWEDIGWNPPVRIIYVQL